MSCALVFSAACSVAPHTLPASSRLATSSTPAQTTVAAYPLAGTVTAPRCAGGYDIIDATVTVRNEAGVIVGSTTTVADAEAKNLALHEALLAVLEPARQLNDRCTVTFTVTVPAAKFYRLTVGTHDGQAYSFEQLKTAGFAVTLSLS